MDTQLIFPKNEDIAKKAIINEWNTKFPVINKLLPAHNVVLQAGAHAGFFAFKLSKFFNTVYTLEPVPELFNLLILNTSHINNIISLNYALGKSISNGIVSYHQPNNIGTSQIQYNNSGNINIITIDSLNLNNLNLLWLDIEGMEYDAILGAINTIKYFKPIIIIENNGLSKQFPASLDGSIHLRSAISSLLNYSFHSRIMRDDIFLPII